MNRAGGSLAGVLFALLLATHALLAIGGEATLSAREWSAIQRVIADQRSALIAGDAEKAFTFAAPAIRDRLGDAKTFLAMVRGGYEAILSARYSEFVDGAVIGDAVIQPLRLVGRDDVVRVALYAMQRQSDGTWRISGCSISASSLLAT
jgi:hypothetical protein